MRTSLLIATFIGVLAACGSGTSKDSNSANSANSANSENSDNGVVGGTWCGGGTACEARLDCRLCRYEADVVAESANSVVVAMGDRVGIAYSVPGEGVWFAREDAPGWSTEQVSTTEPVEHTVRLAIGAGDTPWVTFWTDDYTLHVAHLDGGQWSVEPMSARTAGGIGVTDDGTPWLSYLSTEGELVLASRDSGAWATTTVIETIDAQLAPTTVVAHGDRVAVAWWNPLDGFAKVATWDGELQIDTPFQADERLYMTSTDLTMTEHGFAATAGGAVARHDGTAWSEPVRAGSGRNAGLTIGADGVVRLASAGSQGGLRVAELFADGFVDQIVAKDCDEDAAIDAIETPDGLLLAFACRDGELRVLRRSGLYPADYAAKCQTLGDSLCDAALACHPDASTTSADLCLSSTDGPSHCINNQNCGERFAEDMCGDASQDPDLVDACQPLVADAACWTGDDAGDDDAGITLPASCPAL